MTRTDRILALVLLSAWWLLLHIFRQAPMQVDELNYLYLAHKSWIGTMFMDGKPPFHYILNYALVHAVGIHGAFAFYGLACVLSLEFLCSKLANSRRRYWMALMLLATSPLYVLNSSLFMAETIVFAAVTVVLVRTSISSAVLAVLMKLTAVPALLVIRRKKVLLPVVIAAGVVEILLLVVNTPVQPYTSLSNFHPLYFLDTVDMVYKHFPVWLFFMWPPLLIAAVYRQVMVRDGTRPWIQIGLSLLVSMLVMMACDYRNHYDEPRYIYAIIWCGVVCAVSIVMQGPRWLCFVVAITQLIPSSGILAGEFRSWPAVVVNGMYEPTFNKKHIKMGDIKAELERMGVK